MHRLHTLPDAERRQAAPAWLGDPHPAELRACAHCSHATPCPQHLRRCTEASVVLLHGFQPPVSTARQRHGGCGPDAMRMAAPFLR